jgi:hypothetical protein
MRILSLGYPKINEATYPTEIALEYAKKLLIIMMIQNTISGLKKF